MDEPDWARVVRFIYQNSSDSIGAVIDSDNPIVSEMELDVESANEATRTLSKWSLIEKQPATMKAHVSEENTGTYPDSEAVYTLTEKGFNVAHERELSQRSNRINHSLVFFTFVLVLAQIVGVVPFDDHIRVLWGFVLLVGMGLVVWGTDVFEV